jgi:hypothetical protein
VTLRGFVQLRCARCEANATECPKRDVQWHLRRLRDQGWVVCTGYLECSACAKSKPQLRVVEGGKR